jgi:ribosomal protein S18 acetylase RimI-like enzyme
LIGRSGPDAAAVFDAASVGLAAINGSVPGFDSLVEPDVALSAVGLPIPRLNSANATRFTNASADRRIDEVIAWFEQRGLPFVWRLGPLDTPSDLEARLVARGFTIDPDEMPGMVASLADLPEVELPDAATLAFVDDATTFREWLDVMVVGFGMPSQIGDTFMKYAALGFGEDLPITILARIDGRPVATSLGWVAAGGIEIANVTTVPEARGRGLGRAVTLAAMHAGARAGASIAVLQSTEMGRGVYRRLGFTEFARYRTAIWARE